MFLRVVIPLWCVLCVLPASAWGQMRELWSVRAGVGYLWRFSITAATLDPENSLLITGQKPNQFGTMAPYVRKYDALGRQKWELEFPFYDEGGRHCIECNEKGHAYVSIFSGSITNYGIILTKLSKLGQVLWSHRLEAALGRVDNAPAYSIAVAPSGESYVLYFVNSDVAYRYNLSLAKVDTNGRRLWTRTLPFYYAVVDYDGYSRCVSVTPEGGVVVAAGATDIEGGRRFLASYTKDGTLQWAHALEGSAFSNVLVTKDGNILAGSLFSLVTMNSDGGATSVRDFARSEPRRQTSTGQCLVRRHTGYEFRLLNPGGNYAWMCFEDAYQPCDMVPRGTNGWVAMGIRHTSSFRPAFRFTLFDKDGNQTSRQILESTNAFSSVGREYGLLFKGTDGVLRYVSTPDTGYYYYSTPIISAFGAASDALVNKSSKPVLQIITGPKDVEWDGNTDVSFHAEAVPGAGKLRYQWYFYGTPFFGTAGSSPWEGQTNASLVIPAKEVPAWAGQYFVRVYDDVGELSSCVAELRVNRIQLFTMPENEYEPARLQVTTDSDAAFEVQQSTNLTDWVPAFGQWFRGSMRTDLTQPGADHLFYRARKVDWYP